MVELKLGAILVSQRQYYIPCKAQIEIQKHLDNYLHAVNSATVTYHPVVPNLYTFLGLIPAEAKFFTCLDFQDTFFYIHLAPQSQPIFAFQLENSSTGEKGQ
jgi:hypothetical protein